MGFYAKINENNVVTDIVYVDSDADTNANLYLEQIVGVEGPWIRARNAVNSLNHADYGYIYIKDLDLFMPPKPFDSWIPKHNPNTFNYFWASPIDRPNDGQQYVWDENTLSWVLNVESE